MVASQVEQQWFQVGAPDGQSLVEIEETGLQPVKFWVNSINRRSETNEDYSLSLNRDMPQSIQASLIAWSGAIKY